jgi:hypothetical protein
MSEVGWKDIFTPFVIIVLLASIGGCSDPDDSSPANVGGFNYTNYYIAQFDVANEDQTISAAGPNIFPKKAERERAEGGFVCCISIPSHWRPGMRLVVTWRRDTHPYDDKDRSGDQWLTATTDVPPYGPNTDGFWVHFLPGDRIRVQVQDTPAWPDKPDEHDPYIVQGKLDAELNKQEAKQ